MINNENQPAFVYKNNSRELNHNNYIAISLKGKGKNQFAIGSHIKLFVGNEILSREMVPSRGFQSSVDYKLVIGLGKIENIDSIIIVWPDRSFTKLEKPPINQTHIIEEPGTKNIMPDPVEKVQSTFFSKIASNFDKHEENDVIDFYTERNIPRMLSKEGPKAAVGDVNGDGLDDIFIGGTPGHPGQLYIQTSDGKLLTRHARL